MFKNNLQHYNSLNYQISIIEPSPAGKVNVKARYITHDVFISLYNALISVFLNICHLFTPNSCMWSYVLGKIFSYQKNWQKQLCVFLLLLADFHI